MGAKRAILCCWLFLLAFVPGVQGQDAASDLISRINQLRASLGLHGYALSGALTAAAQNQASWMANTGQISHTQPDGSTPRSRAAAQGYPSSAVSENIYMGSSATAGTAWQWWLNSPIHYRGITNAVYTEVGIAAASGSRGTAFVLVFGNPSGWQAPARPANNSGNTSSSSNEQPSFVVGVDNIGNIMHEIQPEQTLGEIALIYGYTWDDLQSIRDLNEMTEVEGRQLSIGAVILIPPWDGTYTPTPGTPQPTATDESLTPAAAHTVLPTLTPTDTLEAVETPDPQETPEVEVSTPTVPVFDLTEPTITPEEMTEATTPAWSVATVTPTPTAIIVAQAATPPNLSASVVEDDDNTVPLLVVAIVLQVLILGMAGYEFFVRRR